jgi:hypothetical protein
MIAAPTYSTKFGKVPMVGYYIAKKGNAYALFNAQGRKLLPGEFREITLQRFRNTNVIRTVGLQGKVSFYNSNGKLLVTGVDGLVEGYMSNAIYDDDVLGDARQNYFAAYIGDSIGLYEAGSGREILPPRYRYIAWENSKLISLRIGEDSTAMADASGKLVRKPERYGFFTAVDTNRIVTKIYKDNGDKVTTLSDLDGNVLYSSEDWDFDERRYSRLLAPENKRNDHISYAGGLLKVWGNQRENLFLDSNGKEVVFDNFTFVGDFYSGKALAGKMDADRTYHYGIIDIQQHFIYPLTATNMQNLDSGLIEVTQDTLHGVIRQNGSVLIPVQYSRVNKIYDIFCFEVSKGSKSGVIDSTGKLIIPIEYDYIGFDKTGNFFQVTKNEKTGLLAADGTVIIPAEYDELEINRGYSGGRFPVLVKKGNQVFYLDEKGDKLPYLSEKIKGYED